MAGAHRAPARGLRLPAGPARPLAVTTLVHTVGLGLLITASSLYFTRVVGLSVTQVGLGLTVAGCLGILIGIPVGNLSDRTGPRGLLIALMVAEAAAVMSFVLARTFVAFLVVVAAYQMTDRGAAAVRAALIASAVPKSARVPTRAFLRAVTNIGFAFGSLLGGVALTLNNAAAYRAVLALSGVSYLLAALTLFRVPPVPPVAPAARERGASPVAALRDRPYVTFTVLNALLTVHYSILELGMPLWVSGHTDAPPWVITVLFVVNTGIVTALQVGTSRVANSVVTASQATVASGLLLAAACLMFGVSTSMWAGATIALLVLAAVTYTAGEMLHAASSWTLGFDLAPDHAQGQYQGLLSSGASAGQMLGPLVVTTLAIGGGTGGWVTLGLLLLAVSLAVPLAVQCASRGVDLRQHA